MLQCLLFYLPAGAFALCIIVANFLPSPGNNLSFQHSMALHSGLVMSIPLGLDIFLDLSALKSVEWDMLHVSSRIMLFVSLSLPYFVARENELIYHCAELFRTVGACGAIFALTSRFRFVGFGGRFGSAYFQSLLLMATILTYSCLRLATEFGSKNNYLNYASSILEIAFLVQLLLYAVLCCMSLNYKYKSAGVEKISIQELFTAAYLVAFTISAMVVIPCFLLPIPLETSIVIQEYIAIGFLIAVSLIPARVSKVHIAQLEHHRHQSNTFVRYVSHEIRTPLNAVFLGVSFVKNEVDKLYAVCGIAELHSVLETINDVNDSCQVALDTLNELLLFDKFECGKLKTELEPTKPWRFLSDVVKSFRQTAKEGNIDMTLVCDDKESKWYQAYFVELDSTKFGQVMRNLISNALKFTPAGGKVEIIISKISRKCALNSNQKYPNLLNNSIASASQVVPELSNLSTRADPNSFPVLRIEVKDTGAGISPKNLPKLFGQYVQFDANKLQNGGGSGLGLWISKGIVEMHGGTIEALSDGEGRGTCFCVELPLRQYTELSMYDKVDWNECFDADSKEKIQSARSFLADSKEKIQSARSFLAAAPFVGSVATDGMIYQSSPRDDLGCLESGLGLGVTRTYDMSRINSHAFHTLEVPCSWSAGLSFLVVDDSASNRKIIKRLLSSLGHSIHEASDGIVCVRMLTEECQKQLCGGENVNWRSSQYDVILMDDNMPQLSGPEAAKLLRDQGFVGVIIGVTGNTLPQDVKRFQDAGADSVLSKPLNLEHLQHILTDLLSRK